MRDSILMTRIFVIDIINLCALIYEKHIIKVACIVAETLKNGIKISEYTYNCPSSVNLCNFGYTQMLQFKKLATM